MTHWYDLPVVVTVLVVVVGFGADMNAGGVEPVDRTDAEDDLREYDEGGREKLTIAGDDDDDDDE